MRGCQPACQSDCLPTYHHWPPPSSPSSLACCRGAELGVHRHHRHHRMECAAPRPLPEALPPGPAGGLPLPQLPAGGAHHAGGQLQPRQVRAAWQAWCGGVLAVALRGRAAGNGGSHIVYGCSGWPSGRWPPTAVHASNPAASLPALPCLIVSLPPTAATRGCRPPTSTPCGWPGTWRRKCACCSCQTC